MFLVAIEATIVATAMPQIVAQIGGLDLYSWVFSSFLLTQTALTVVFGKLADLYGRKPVMLAGIGIFLVGSILAGFAWSMPSMIAFRLIQGMGAGTIHPVAMTIVADLYPARERGKVQGYLASVWAISAVIGPMVGGLIIDNVSWAWIFWISIPIGLAAAIGFVFYLREEVHHESRSVDYAGAVLFTATVATLMFSLTMAGNGHSDAASLGAFGVCLFFILFVAQERRAPDPMVSFSLWRRRPVATVNGAAVLAGMILMGLTTFLPMYVQGVLHRSPTVAGFTLTMLVLGWPLGATVCARAFPVFGLRRMMIIGGALMPAGAAVFVGLNSESSPVLAAGGSLVVGFGMGLLAVSSMILIQGIVDWSQRGGVTASNLFARNLGSTLGAAVFGAVLNIGLTQADGIGAVPSSRLLQIFEKGPGTDPILVAALQGALHLTFCIMFMVSLFVVALVVMVPPTVAGDLRETSAEKRG